MDRPLKLALDEFGFKITHGEELLVIWMPSDPRAWAAFPPLFKGKKADHLTIPLKPLGDGSGRWRPHLNYGKEGRHDIADLPFDLVTEKLQGISDELGRRIRKVLEPTTPEALDAFGYRLIAPPKKWARNLASAGEHFFRRKVSVDYLTLDKKFLRRWWRKLIVSHREVSPLALHSRWAKKSTQPLQVVHAQLGAAFVYYVPQQNRWVMGPRDMSKIVEEIVSVVFGPELYYVMFEIFRELQIPCDVEDIVHRWWPDARKKSTPAPEPESPVTEP